MFSEQCLPWGRLTQKYVSSVFSSLRKTLFAALKHVTDYETAERLKFELVEPKIVELEALVEKRLAERPEPHTQGHPITYNHYLTGNIQKVQQARHESRVRSAMENFMDPSSTKPTKKEFVSAELFLVITNSTQ